VIARFNRSLVDSERIYMLQKIYGRYLTRGAREVLLRYKNEPLGAKGPPLVGEEVRKEDVGKVRS
jgi:hypothetical protein